MCDTFVALGSATVDGSVIFGKNSDRHPNEGHQVTLIPRAIHAKGSIVNCTYLRIPQVEETFAVLLAKPFWIWGAEMGANEHGVVIGNEAVFTKIPYQKKPGLLGMDLLRLGLERARTAKAALEVIVELLGAYGQGGNHGLIHEQYYHNSFIIADFSEAWVLEMVGQEWVAEKVKDIRTISNALSIGHEWYLSSPGLVESAISRGLWPKHKDFDFASCYSDMIYTRFGAGRQRQCRTTDLLRQNLGKINVADGTAILRDHGEQAGPGWSPANGLMGMQVCAHAGFGPVRSSQSVGSMVSQIRKDNQTHWVTGTSAPCTSIFKPVWIDAGLPDLGQAPGAEYNQATLFWQHEVLHREVLRDYPTRLAAFRQNRDDLETRFRSGADAAQPNLPVERLHYSRRCFEEAEQATLKWLEAVQMTPLKNRMPLLYGMAWRSFDQQSKRSA